MTPRPLLVAMIAVSCFAPTIARADDRGVGSVALDGSIGWLHSSVFDTRLDLADVRVGIGGSAQVPRGIGVEISGTLGLQLGRTQAGRALSGYELLGAAMVMHWRWLRVGVGARIGVLGENRSTNGDHVEHFWTDGYGSLGVEPFAVSNAMPVFFDVEGHVMNWGGNDIRGLQLRVGLRFCGEGCAF